MLESYPITLDGCTFAWNGITELLDADSNSLICTKLDGWFGAPARRLAQVDRPKADGSFDGDAYRGPRTITFEGQYFAMDPLRFRTLERALAGICADPKRRYPLVVADELGPLTAYVRHAGEVKLSPVSDVNGILSMSLTAPDPLRQGPWSSYAIPAAAPGTGGVVSTSPGVVSSSPGVNAGTAPSPTTITITNPGNAPAILVAQFDGPATSPSIVRASDGAQAQLGATLLAGDSLLVNLSAQYAHDVPGMTAGTFLYGRSVFGPGGYAGGGGLTVTNGVWPTIGPGETATFVITGGGPGQVHMRPTYW